MIGRRLLGNTGIEVTEIGLGTAQLANTDGNSPSVRLVSPEGARLVIEEAIEFGISFFDTGDQYGTAECLLGALPVELQRRIVVATKAGLRDDGVRDFSDAYLESRLMRSLKRLNVECVDIFQLNKPSIGQLISGKAMEFLDQQKRRGTIRYAGVVVGEPETGFACLEAGVVDCIQVLYNLTYQTTEPLIAEAYRRGVGVIVRSPLNSGLLSGTVTPKTQFRDEDERSRYFRGAQFESRVTAIQAIAADLEVDPTSGLLELALRFIKSNSGVSTMIPGTSRRDQLLRYVGCAELPALTADEMTRVRAAVKHRMVEIDAPVQLQ